MPLRASVAERIFNPAIIPFYNLVSWPVGAISGDMVVRQLSGLEPGSRVLDVGVGTGITAEKLVKRLGLVVDGIDVSRAMLAEAKGKLPGSSILLHGDAARLPFEAKSYDAVVYNYVLRYQNIGQAENTLSEIPRVLKPGGMAIITDLNFPRLRPMGQPVGESADALVLGAWSLFSHGEFKDYMSRMGMQYVRTLYPPLSFMIVFKKV